MGHCGGRGLAAGAGHAHWAAAAPADAGLIRFGQPRFHFESVESTQAEARRLADEGAPEGTLVTADRQTSGRGRLGNSFFSPRGGLYCSLVLRPATATPLIGLAAGLALAEAVSDVTGLRPVLKWPNDLLLNGRKLSGVLLEVTPRYAIQGIGVNVNTPAFPDGIGATSLLRELGAPVAPEELLEALLGRFEARCADLGPDLLDAWRRWPNLLGSRVRTEACEGVAEDLDEDGALLVRTPDGLYRVVASEVHLLA